MWKKGIDRLKSISEIGQIFPKKKMEFILIEFSTLWEMSASERKKGYVEFRNFWAKKEGGLDEGGTTVKTEGGKAE